MLYNLLAQRWLEEQLIFVEKRTFLRYKEILETHILPSFAQKEIESINKKDIQNFIINLKTSGNKRTGKELANNSILQIVSVLKRIFDYAINEEVIMQNPIHNLKLKYNQKQVEAFTEIEQKKIETYIMKANNIRLYGVIIALYTGVRIGELLALKWEDVNFVENTLLINKTLSPIKISDETGFISTPKTSSAIRLIHYPKQLNFIFKKLKAFNGKYVISSYKKGIVTISNYQKTFSKLLQKINIEHKGFHSLRHTFATRAIELGTDIKTLSEILGHSNPTITLNRYIHSSEKQKKFLAKKLGTQLEKYN